MDNHPLNMYTFDYHQASDELPMMFVALSFLYGCSELSTPRDSQALSYPKRSSALGKLALNPNFYAVS